MPYVRRIWQNSPSTATPLTATALNNIEDGVEEAVEAVTGRLAEATLEDTIVSVGTPVAEGVIASTVRLSAAALGLKSRQVVPYPSPPTLAFSLSASPPIASAVTWGILDGPGNLIGCIPLLSSGALDTGYVRNTIGQTDTDANRAPYGYETIADGDIALRFRAFVATPRFRVYINDQPCSTATVALSGITVAGGTNFYLHIPHPAVGTAMRIRVMIAQAGLRWVEAAATTTVQRPDFQRPKVFVFGTSFSCNAGSTTRFLDTWVTYMAERFGVEVFNFARSGAGYVGDGSNTIAAQVAVAAAATTIEPDLIIDEGSGNDISINGATLQAAAAAVYASQNTTWAGVPTVAIGMGPRGSTGETADVAANVITYTKAAADAAANVIAFLDPIGSVTSMPTYTTGAAYTAGQIVKVLGSAMRARAAIASAPATVDRTAWENLSHLFGTGYAGATASDGNRDIAVDTDGLHPTARGSALMENRYSTWLERTLATA